MAKITWTFKNEEGTNLNRYIATNVSTGEKITFDLLRGGNISVVGTPLNAENLNALITSINACYDLISSSEKDTTYTLSKNGNAIRLTSSSGAINDVTLNKSDVGLGNVDNTSDMDKPISTAQQQGLNKPLYNLGAFDTISGNVITRQTGYGKFEDLNWILTNVDGHYFWICLDLQNTIFKPSDNYTPSNNFIVTNQNINYVGGYQVSTTGDLGIDTSGAISYDNGSSTEKPSGIFQYKLATSYTEEIIEGQPLITLDQQGSQWLRSEWEKGLNLVNDTIYSGQVLDCHGYVQNDVLYESGAKPILFDIFIARGEKFSFSFYGGAAESACYLLIQKSDGKWTQSFLLGATTTNALRKYENVSFDFDIIKVGFGVYSSGKGVSVTGGTIMFNKGDHAYPYQPYNSKAHITNYEADFLKEESLKSANLWGNTNSVLNITANPSYNNYFSYSNEETLYIKLKAGTYTIKGNVGYATYSTNVPNLNVSYTKIGAITNAVTFSCSTEVFFSISHSLNDELTNIMLNEGTEPLPYQEYNGSIVREKQIKELDNKKVPTTRTINGKALNEDISLSASDVGARPSSWTPSKSDVGLEKVDNTSDADKPISNATQTALNNKANSSDLNAHTGNTNNPHNVTKTQLGLEKVDNTSDSDKNVASAKILKNNEIGSFTLSDGFVNGIDFNSNSVYLIYDSHLNFIIRIGDKSKNSYVKSTVCYDDNSKSKPLWFYYENNPASGLRLYLKTLSDTNYVQTYSYNGTFNYKLLSTD